MYIFSFFLSSSSSSHHLLQIKPSIKIQKETHKRKKKRKESKEEESLEVSYFFCNQHNHWQMKRKGKVKDRGRQPTFTCKEVLLFMYQLET